MPTDPGAAAGGRWAMSLVHCAQPPARNGLRFRRPGPCLAGFCFALLVSGCGVVKTAVDVPTQTVRAMTPGKKTHPAADPVEVQQTLLRFADEYSRGMITGLDKLRRGTNAIPTAELLQWRISILTETCSIASGPNAVANLLDMTVFVSVTRMSLEEYWRPKVFGESALPLLEIARNAETEIWRFGDKVITPEHQAELRRAIEQWHRQNPFPENMLAARALDFASRVAEAGQDKAAKPESVFSLLRVDPLAGMDPAVREIAQTRLFAERALYVTQKMPMLLRWQTELLSLDAMKQPTVQQVVTNSTQIAAAVERFAAVAEKLPGQLSAERQEILKALEAQEKTLTPLVNEVRQTLTAGSLMSTSLNTTLTTFDSLMKRFGVGETNNPSPPDTNAQPFRIQDYGQMAIQLEAAARQLTELLVTLDRTIGSTNLAQLSAQASPVIQQARSGGREIVDYAFWKGLLLAAFVLVAALLHRFLTARIAPRARPGNTK